MIFSLFFGFLSGIWLGSLLHFRTEFLLTLVFLAVLFFLCRYFFKNKIRLTVPIALIFLLGALGGLLRVSFSDLYENSQLDAFAEQRLEALAVVSGDPDERETHTKLTARLSEIFLNGESQIVREKVLVTVPLYPSYSYGDKIRLKMTLEKPVLIESEDGRAFDYVGFLRVRGIWYMARYAEVQLVSSGHGAYIKTALFKLKHTFLDSINSALPPPQSSLLSGLILGTKQALGKEMLEDFRRTGVTHVVVLSGSNIVIVANAIMALFAILLKSKRMSFSFGILSIALFTVLAGAESSAVRAAIMVSAALLAQRFGRDYRAGRVLGLTVFLMLAPNPLLLVFDPSFQLSVLATVGLVFVSPRITHYFTWITEKYKLREVVSTTIATQLTVLPLLIYSTGLLSLVSLPVNVLILPFIPVTMFFGFVTGLFGLFSLYLSFLPAFFSYILLYYELAVIKLGSLVPSGAVSLPAFSPVILVFVYALLFAGLYYLKKKKAAQ